MARDIHDAIENNEQLTLHLKMMSEQVKEIGKERGSFIAQQDKIEYRIKDFENVLNEHRGLQQRDYIDLKKDVTKRLDTSLNEVKELSIDRRQLKAMIKNQNYHFTEMQKEIGVTKSRVKQLENTASEIPGILSWIEETDTYLQNYLPMEQLREIHFALQASLTTAPTKQRLDQVEHSQKRVTEMVEKIKQIGTLGQERFMKNEYQTLKIDFDAYHLRTIWEDEEKAKVEEARKAEAAAMIRRSSGQLFNDKLFQRETLKKLHQAIEKKMEVNLKKWMDKSIESHQVITKLVKFYKEEVGSDVSYGSESGASSKSSSASDESGSEDIENEVKLNTNQSMKYGSNATGNKMQSDQMLNTLPSQDSIK